MKDRLRYRFWENEDWHDTNSPLEAVYCNAVDGCDPTIAVSDFEFCTGLKDKNGNLIYESDYVKDKDGDIYLVKWDAELVQFNATGKDNCGFETITPFMKGETETLEICGNIHDQAEQKDVK